MKWPDIKAALEKRGTSLSAIADKAGLSRWYFSQVKHRPLRRPQQLIADALGVHPADLWPDRYDARGRFIDGRRKRNCEHGSHPSTRDTAKGSRAA